MMIRRSASLIATALAASQAFADGTVELATFYSSALGDSTTLEIYLPEGYELDGGTYYPTAYWLHGLGDAGFAFPELVGLLDAMIRGGDIEPMIIVKPYGIAGDLGGSLWANSELYGNYEDLVTFDCPAFVEEHYRVIQDPSARGIFGVSMGGHGAMYLALKHPERYAAIASHAGFHDFRRFEDLWVPEVLAENPAAGDPPVRTYDPISGFFTQGFFAICGAFAPDLDDPPYFVDFLLDEHGELVPEVWDAWLANSPATLASSLPPDADLAIYFDCGTADELLFYPFNEDFHGHLLTLGIEHEFVTDGGSHGVPMVPRLQRSITFLAAHLPPPVVIGVGASTEAALEPITVRAVNPVRSSMSVTFSLPEAGTMALELFDARGNRVMSRRPQVLEAGAHEVEMEVGHLPAGVYLCRIRSERHRGAGKLVVSR